MEENNYCQPLNSHLITFEPRKVAVVRGWIQSVSGILLSQYLLDGQVVTNRTILAGEEMVPDSDIGSDEESCSSGIHFLKSYPNLTMADIRAIVKSAEGNRPIRSLFNELLDLGYMVYQSKEDLVMTISKSTKEYKVCCDEIGDISITLDWSFFSLEPLFSIQSFLKRRIVLDVPKYSSVSLDTVSMMNHILNCQYERRLFFCADSDCDFVFNDGANTYYRNGETVAMSHDEFTRKYPNSYEVMR